MTQHLQSQRSSNKKPIETAKATTIGYQTAVIHLHCQFSNTQLTNICFKKRSIHTQSINHAKANMLITAFDNYFNKKEETFTHIDIAPQGTPFQQRVWQALQGIPYGQTRTYQQLAQQLNTSARAVGNACRANPIPIIIPCHRILAKSGIGGFMGKKSGHPLKIKQFLLTIEQTN